MPKVAIVTDEEKRLHFNTAIHTFNYRRNNYIFALNYCNMLQRIQSLQLLVASLAIFALFLFPMVNNAHVGTQSVSIMVTGTYVESGGQTIHTQSLIGPTIATVLVGLIPLIIIFLYKKRKQQIALCYSAMLVIVGLSFWMAQLTKPIMGDAKIDTHNWGIGLLLFPVAILFLVLAVKAIQRDEKLIKSVDRLR
jgi:hypothetical protein